MLILFLAPATGVHLAVIQTLSQVPSGSEWFPVVWRGFANPCAPFSLNERTKMKVYFILAPETGVHLAASQKLSQVISGSEWFPVVLAWFRKSLRAFLLE